MQTAATGRAERRQGWRAKPVIAVERGDERRQRSDRGEIALLDAGVGQPQRRCLALLAAALLRLLERLAGLLGLLGLVGPHPAVAEHVPQAAAAGRRRPRLLQQLLQELFRAVEQLVLQAAARL